MPRKLTDEQGRELRTLEQRIRLTIDFVENAQQLSSAGELRAIVDAAVAKQDLRTVRLLNREISDMTLGLAPHEREGLEAMLQARLGMSAATERAAMSQMFARALARGSIASEKERQHLEAYAEMLEATQGDESELAAVRRFLQSG
jgi:hypothetical protein